MMRSNSREGICAVLLKTANLQATCDNKIYSVATNIISYCHTYTVYILYVCQWQHFEWLSMVAISSGECAAHDYRANFTFALDIDHNNAHTRESV